VAQGVHGRRRVGTGETFWQYRPYASHDSAHSIDWRRSARSDDLYLRETEWEASQSVWLWADHSASMHYKSSTNRSTKAARAALLLLASSAALLRGGERLGLLGLDRRASGGRLSLRSMAERFYAMPEDHSGLPPSVDLPKYSQGLLFSDFLGPAAAWEKRFAEFAEQRVRGLAVQVLAPAEETLPFAGVRAFWGWRMKANSLQRKSRHCAHPIRTGSARIVMPFDMLHGLPDGIFWCITRIGPRNRP